MEVCKVCGAFLIVGDAPARLDDHMQGKQHVGYQKLRTAVEEITVRNCKHLRSKQLFDFDCVYRRVARRRAKNVNFNDRKKWKTDVGDTMMTAVKIATIKKAKSVPGLARPDGRMAVIGAAIVKKATAIEAITTVVTIAKTDTENTGMST